MRLGLGVAMCLLIGAVSAFAQSTPSDALSRAACVASGTERTYCAGDTSAGVMLIKSNGPTECLLGRNWGYDQRGVWVSDGCNGEFAFGAPSQQVTTPDTTPAPQNPREPTPRIETWGEFDPGDGFLVARTKFGELAISGYGLVRFIDQTPVSQTFTDHLGVERTTDGRNDIWPHRIIIYLKGWLADPKLIYTVFFWTVNATDQRAIFINLGYQFSRKFSVYAGIAGNPGTRSMQGSHPYWLGHDRVMADEFFRPYFGSGVWAQGEAFKGFWYNAMIANSNSQLGVTAVELDRRYTTSGSLWWMPTTKEFGPRGGYGDYEWHEDIATRFGISTTQSREQRYTDTTTNATTNTTLKLADSVNVFDRGALAPGVTIDQVDFRILSFDAGVKYHGVFLQTEIYHRWLDNLIADGVLPVSSILDRGYYVQGAFYPLPKKIEVYGATSQIYGDKDAGFGNASEYLAGMNYYPFDTRDIRLNVQVIDVNHSPVSSTFGYYTAGQDGTTVSAAFSVLF
ncbi:MAG TPA: DUF3011 domain-containing protein [Vicinamibacterales bacterium]|jgi:Protein of unknown function (DUF3011).